VLSRVYDSNSRNFVQEQFKIIESVGRVPGYKARNKYAGLQLNTGNRTIKTKMF
jgi:hypothetical protein